MDNRIEDAIPAMPPMNKRVVFPSQANVIAAAEGGEHADGGYGGEMASGTGGSHKVHCGVEQGGTEYIYSSRQRYGS